MSFTRDMSFADQMTDQVCQIVGPLLLRPASFELDTKQATDLVVIKCDGLTIGSRVRRPGYAESYPFEITMRFKRHNGTKTEFAKIREGWCDWFFYGHTDRSNNIHLWWLIDLNVFRAALILDDQLNGATRIECEEKQNRDCSTSFLVFDLRSFPVNPPLLIGSSRPLPAFEHADFAA